MGCQRWNLVQSKNVQSKYPPCWTITPNPELPPLSAFHKFDPSTIIALWVQLCPKIFIFTAFSKLSDPLPFSLGCPYTLHSVAVFCQLLKDRHTLWWPQQANPSLSNPFPLSSRGPWNLACKPQRTAEVVGCQPAGTHHARRLSLTGVTHSSLTCLRKRGHWAGLWGLSFPPPTCWYPEVPLTRKRIPLPPQKNNFVLKLYSRPFSTHPRSPNKY